MESSRSSIIESSGSGQDVAGPLVSSSSKKHESLWSLSSFLEVDEQQESPLRNRLNKATIIAMLSVLLFVCVAAIAVSIGVVLGVTNKKKPSNSDVAKSDSAFLAANSSSGASGQQTTLCSAYSHGGVFYEYPGLSEQCQRSVLNPELWLDKTDFNLTFTNEQVGGLYTMGLNSSYEAIRGEWDYASQPMKGVNLGGWFVLEPFITPEKFGGDVVDEWTYCELLYNQNGAARVQRVMEAHYATFITENDFEQIAAAGLDHVRIPFGYWLVADSQDTPYLPFVGWRYLLRGIEWARKYGLRVFLDLHAVPGSQNGWNHSGREQPVPAWLSEDDARGEEYGAATLEIHRRLATFFSQERYRNLVMFYGLVNEPLASQLGPERVTKWHQDAYKIVSASGFPHYIVAGDGLMGAQYYNQGQFPAAEYPRMVLDVHQYMAFDTYLLGLPHGAKNAFVCHEWAQMLNGTDMPVLVGEWSAAVNDCGTYVNNVGAGARWEGNFTGNSNSGSASEPVCAGGVCRCDAVADATLRDAAYQQFLRAYASNQMGVYQRLSWGWMFWTWKAESNPQWSLKTLLEAGVVQLSNDPPLDDTTDWRELGLDESV